MPAIIDNAAAEAMLLDIRAGRQATRQTVGSEPGALLAFGTSIVIPGRAGGQLVYPLALSAEPATLVTSRGNATVRGTVAGVSVSGAFSWTVGGGDLEPARYRFTQRGRLVSPPSWAGQLPRSERLVSADPPRLSRQQAAVRRRAREAEHRLLSLSERVVRRDCHGAIARALSIRPGVDVDDLVQRGMQTVARLLPIYASPARPPCSWLGMLRLDGRRDLRRELTRLDWLPSGAATAAAMADACGVRASADPAATHRALSDAAQRHDRPVPRLGPRQLNAALLAPAVLLHEAAVASLVEGPDTLDWEVGALAAMVARLVTDDSRLVTLAALGDPVALEQVGQRVAPRLADRGEGAVPARRRCWEQFRASGQLFASTRGLDRFAGAADPSSLAALDDRLCLAAGVSVAVAPSSR